MKTEKESVNKLLRKEIFETLRKKLDKEEAEKIIFAKIVDCPQYVDANKILCYFAKENEVNTFLIIEDALKRKKQLGLPVMVNETLKFLSVNKNTTFNTGKYGITEPSEGEILNNADIIIVPMVAFDRDCNRLGHGKGYYDRFLAKEKGFRIGIAFSEQEGEIETFPHDIAMDMVITEKDIFYRASVK